ncbi:hypothetical protein GCM10010869_58820 [Mesorhizobium tianshanense]|nr:hypothetical protein GCM10010869_58820 [Mesorhizobium tianshanense]
MKKRGYSGCVHHRFPESAREVTHETVGPVGEKSDKGPAVWSNRNTVRRSGNDHAFAADARDTDP